MIAALQYYDGDRDAAFRLARLLADLEPSFRPDVLLALCCQPDTKIDDETLHVLAECSKKFTVEHVVSRYGCAGWADGSGQLWRGTVTHFAEPSSSIERAKDHVVGEDPKRRRPYREIMKFLNPHEVREFAIWMSTLHYHEFIATLDAGDGVPLHCNWVDLLVAEHHKTRSLGKRVTGLLNLDVPQYPHIHGNMVFDLSFAREHPGLFDTPLGASEKEWWRCWDTYHAHVFLAEARPSTVVRNRWRGWGISEGIMDEAARSSVWLHGYKDPELADVARRRLLGSLGGKPTTPVLLYQDHLVGSALATARENAVRVGYGKAS